MVPGILPEPSWRLNEKVKYRFLLTFKGDIKIKIDKEFNMKKRTTNLMQANNSRRNFIKTATIASAGFMIVPRHVLGGKGFIAPSDKLNIRIHTQS